MAMAMATALPFQEEQELSAESDAVYSDTKQGEKENEESRIAKIVEWEDFQDALARLCGLKIVLDKARAKKTILAQELCNIVEIRKKSLMRVDALEALEKKLQQKQIHFQHLKTTLQESANRLVQEREELHLRANSLLYAARALERARRHLQDAERLLAGEGGSGRLVQLQKLLTARRRCMVAQVASLYPLAPCSYSNDSFMKPTCSGRDGLSHASGDTLDFNAMTVAGLHLIVPASKKFFMFNEKHDYETSAVALGYVAHAVSLLASYLDVYLRYPIRFGASHSFIQDCSPLKEMTVVNTGAILLPPENPSRQVQFPLYSAGQDPTRAAYAVFLLNKDLEQVLNYLGVESVGPRHVLPNLHRIIKTVFSEGKLLA